MSIEALTSSTHRCLAARFSEVELSKGAATGRGSHTGAAIADTAMKMKTMLLIPSSSFPSITVPIYDECLKPARDVCDATPSWTLKLMEASNKGIRSAAAAVRTENVSDVAEGPKVRTPRYCSLHRRDYSTRSVVRPLYYKVKLLPNLQGGITALLDETRLIHRCCNDLNVCVFLLLNALMSE